jgi:S-formylglutathione hydrolase FrmB
LSGSPGRSSTARRRLALAAALIVIAAITLFAAIELIPQSDDDRTAPSAKQTIHQPAGAGEPRLVEITLRSAAVGDQRPIEVLWPSGPPKRRPLLVFLHGHGQPLSSFTENPAVLDAMARMGERAPIVAFPDGGYDSYWHDRNGGDWATYVLDEAVPTLARRFAPHPRLVAIGGISMGGFGAYHLGLRRAARFCAIGGHSAALWFDSSEAFDGAFDSRADFRRTDVIAAVRSDPGAFGDTPTWNDIGRNDPFFAGNLAFVSALRESGTHLTARVWPGGHDYAYWDRHWPDYLRFYADALERC